MIKGEEELPMAFGEGQQRWNLQCNNKKCRLMFWYFGRLRTNRGIRCDHCGKSSQYRIADFIKHNRPEEKKG
jgi:hypothetical protein